MTAAMLVLEPIFEADLPPEQYAYRPGRNAQQAVAIARLVPQPGQNTSSHGVPAIRAARWRQSPDPDDWGGPVPAIAAAGTAAPMPESLRRLAP
jgi:hypothetical protein